MLSSLSEKRLCRSDPKKVGPKPQIATFKAPLDTIRRRGVNSRLSLVCLPRDLRIASGPDAASDGLGAVKQSLAVVTRT